MYTKEELKQQLKEMGLKSNDAVMVHSSMKSLGDVEDGADTVIDAFMEYFSEGLLMTPTHTWKQMSAEYIKGEEHVTTPCPPDGSIKSVQMHRHYNPTTDHISETFDKMKEGYFETGAAKAVRLGDAECILCDAEKIFEVTGKILTKEKNCFIDCEKIPSEWYL